MKRQRWMAAGKVALKGSVAVVVLIMVGQHVAGTWGKLAAEGWSFRVDPGLLVLALGLYLAGLVCFGTVYWRVLRASPTPVGLLPTLRAYLIGHLGKYVPGKALVVVIRVGLLTPFGARPATAAFGTLYETLLMMSTGGLVAAAGFATGGANTLWALGLGLGLGVGFLAVVEPRVFPRISKVLSLPFPNVGPEALPAFSHRLLGVGLVCSFTGWICWGFSLVAVIWAVDQVGVAVALWPQVVASVALATVAGFVVAVLPGGLGLREGIIMVTLEPVLGPRRGVAVVSALILRLVWVAGELLAAAALAGLRPPRAIEETRA